MTATASPGRSLPRADVPVARLPGGLAYRLEERALLPRELAPVLRAPEDVGVRVVLPGEAALRVRIPGAAVGLPLPVISPANAEPALTAANIRARVPSQLASSSFLLPHARRRGISMAEQDVLRV